MPNEANILPCNSTLEKYLQCCNSEIALVFYVVFHRPHKYFTKSHVFKMCMQNFHKINFPIIYLSFMFAHKSLRVSNSIQKVFQLSEWIYFNVRNCFHYVITNSISSKISPFLQIYIEVYLCICNEFVSFIKMMLPISVVKPRRKPIPLYILNALHFEIITRLSVQTVSVCIMSWHEDSLLEFLYSWN